MQAIYDANSGNTVLNQDIDAEEQLDAWFEEYITTGEVPNTTIIPNFDPLNPYATTSIDPLYSADENRSINFLESSVNNHSWYGFLSTFNHKINENLDMAAGIDLRSYRGEHYRQVYDLLGGDYFVGSRGSGQDNAIGYTNTSDMVHAAIGVITTEGFFKVIF